MSPVIRIAKLLNQTLMMNTRTGIWLACLEVKMDNTCTQSDGDSNLRLAIKQI